MRKMMMFLVATVATVTLQAGLGAPASAAAERGTATAAQAPAEAALGWAFWDKYTTLDFCNLIGAFGMAGGAWDNFNCVYVSFDAEPWYLYVQMPD